MIIKSILDTDLYKFTTSYAYMKLFPQARGTFEFIDRDNTEYPEDFIERLYLELGSLGMLHLTKDEQEYMNNNCRFIPSVYWEWLLKFHYPEVYFDSPVEEIHKFTDMMRALRESIALTPTDGLGISNSDLDQIGAKSYAEVDDILSTLIELNSYCAETPNERDNKVAKDMILSEKYGEDVVNKVWNRYLASEFKRKKAPIYISRKLYE